MRRGERQCTDQTKKKKKKERKEEKRRATDWTSPCASAHGHFCHLPIKFLPLNFLSILERKHFGGPKEKTLGLYQFFFFPSLPLTKHSPKKFSFLFSLQSFLSTLFHLQTNMLIRASPYLISSFMDNIKWTKRIFKKS